MDKKTKWNEEETRNMVGLFQILLNVDKRINPHIYEAKKETDNKRRTKVEKYN
jgi:hypothetical protein